MKKQFLLLSAIGLLLFSCKNDEGVSVAPKKRTIDTTLVYGVYLGYQRKGKMFGPMRRFVFDSVQIWNIKGKDSSTATRTWGSDSAYIGELFIPVKDSLTAAAVGLKNWNGKDTVVSKIEWLNKSYVFDVGLTEPAALKRLGQYMDTTRPKVDSAK